jgi:flagellar protein FlaG
MAAPDARPQVSALPEPAPPKLAAADQVPTGADQTDQTSQAGRGAPSLAEMQAAAKEFREYLSSMRSEMSFGFDEEAERPYFKLINPETGEVVKQFPADEFLTMVKRLREVSDLSGGGGVLMDQRL